MTPEEVTHFSDLLAQLTVAAGRAAATAATPHRRWGWMFRRRESASLDTLAAVQEEISKTYVGLIELLLHDTRSGVYAADSALVRDLTRHVAAHPVSTERRGEVLL